MATRTMAGVSWRPESTGKGTSIGRGILKTSSMNKSKKRSYKAYRGQGK
jgi:hypothetical protein